MSLVKAKHLYRANFVVLVSAFAVSRLAKLLQYKPKSLYFEGGGEFSDCRLQRTAHDKLLEISTRCSLVLSASILKLSQDWLLTLGLVPRFM